jgi:hypothetical protein
MYLLNLTLGQFLVLFGSVSALTVALYLLDRSRRRQVVSTLRFWVAAEQPPAARRRKHIQQPISLLLQLLSIALLLLAIGELRWGSKAAAPRDHVILLDTSAWMASHAPNSSGKTLMAVAQERAKAYLKAIPSRDRVMLVRADAMATPATAFEFDRKRVSEAIAESSPSATALNIEQAVAFAHRIQQQSGRRAGEVAYVGASRIATAETPAVTPEAANLRVIAVADRVENRGIRKMGARRSETDPGIWDINVAVRNYGDQPREVQLALGFGGATVASRRLSLPPSSEKETIFEYRTKAAGILEARLFPADDFSADNRAALELPPAQSLKVTVYSDEPDLLRPVFTSNPAVTASFHPTGEYRAGNNGAIVILDHFQPASRPLADAIWLDPPAGASPIPIKSQVKDVTLSHWNSEGVLGQGLHTKDLKLDLASVFLAAPGDVKLGEVDAGPVIVARDGRPKVVVMGFHPARTSMRYELAMPLLFANVMRWMAPASFRRTEMNAGSVGTVTAKLEDGLKEQDVRVIHEDGTELPFTLHNGSLQFFSGKPGTVRVEAGDRQYVYSLTLPQLWDAAWKPQAGRHGVPRPAPPGPTSLDLWQWLALAGAAVLALEWFLYGRSRRGSVEPIRRAAAVRKAS